MRKLFTILLFVCFYASTFGQNLVPNPGFDSLSECPFFLHQIYKAPPWFQPFFYPKGTTSGSSSTDLYATCATHDYCKVPENIHGNQHPRSGSAYAGIIVYDPTQQDYREYIEVQLDSALRENQVYCFSIYLSLADHAEYAIDKFGVYFSADSTLDSNDFNALAYLAPQIELNPGIVNDTNNWTQLTGYYRAKGGEQYLTFGNFRKDKDTYYAYDSLKKGVSLAYYYVDDVSLSPCEMPPMGLNGTEETPVRIYPNPAGSFVTIAFENPAGSACEILVFNSMGQLVREIHNVTDETAVLQRNSLSEGLYYFRIQSHNRQLGFGSFVFE